METDKIGDKMGNNINKKGQTPAGVVLTVVILFGLAIAGLVTYYIVSETMEQIIAVPEINKTAESVTAFQVAQDLNDKWDYLIFFAFIGSALGLIILGFFIDVNTVFLPFYIIALIVGVLLSGILSYVWGVVSVNFPEALTHFTLTNHLLSNLMVYFSVVGVIAMIGTYAKVRSENGF